MSNNPTTVLMCTSSLKILSSAAKTKCPKDAGGGRIGPSSRGGAGFNLNFYRNSIHKQTKEVIMKISYT
jgi:hypothetical protein